MFCAFLQVQSREQAPGVGLKNGFSGALRKRRNGLNGRLDIVIGAPRRRIQSAAATGPLGPEATPIHAHDIEQQLERELVVQNRVEPEFLQNVVEGRSVF